MAMNQAKQSLSNNILHKIILFSTYMYTYLIILCKKNRFCCLRRKLFWTEQFLFEKCQLRLLRTEYVLEIVQTSQIIFVFVTCWNLFHEKFILLIILQYRETTGPASSVRETNIIVVMRGIFIEILYYYCKFRAV